MICPVCQKEMIVEDLGGVQVEICSHGCKGMWFDWGELKKLEHNNQGFGNALQEALAFPRNNDADRGAIKCPKCGIVMHKHLFESEKEINVDECYQCGGFFLDSGELKIIRDKFMSEAERQAYEDKLLNQIPDYVKAKVDLEKYNDRAEAIHRYTKFLYE